MARESIILIIWDHHQATRVALLVGEDRGGGGDTDAGVDGALEYGGFAGAGPGPYTRRLGRQISVQCANAGHNYS